MLKIHMFAPEIGGQIGERGNPEILAIDSKTGIIVSIEVESQYWKSCLKHLGELKGVGIYPVNAITIPETGKKN